MDDAEDEDDAVFGNEVVHDPVVADAEPVECVGVPADRPHLLAADATASRRRFGESLEAGADPLTQRRRELPESALGRGGKSNLVGAAQAISPSEVDRPRR